MHDNDYWVQKHVFQCNYGIVQILDHETLV